ncbi:MAG: alcohol dehydrogenase catalytic domain-containing protein, partial [Acidimicrobiales bacterium]|nr:alcohol dehydrogenase catalytic domain-containing protein [Acidimicrobiales bacterium]
MHRRTARQVDEAGGGHDLGVLGHEGVGRVLTRGAGVRSLEPGQRVIMSYGACGRCPSCAAR